MLANKYQEMALITARLLDNKDDYIINGALGLAGECGEVVDLIKKWKYQGKNLDKELIIEELGDVCWYVALLSAHLNIDLETIMSKNIEKLKKRYPNGFEVKQ